MRLEPVSEATHNPSEETAIRNFTLGIVGAAALVASLLLIRQQKSPPKEAVAESESASAITLERMRELGL
jgi:hypothetical protein